MINRIMSKISSRAMLGLLSIMMIALPSFVMVGSIIIQNEKRPVILYNQIGYLPNEEKIFMVELPSNDTYTMANPGSFTIDNSAGTPVITTKNLIYLGELWNRYYACGNFSELTTEGEFRIVIQSSGYKISSSEFQISHNVYDKVLERAVNYYYYERCGSGIESVHDGYLGHNPCHLDDGVYIDLGNGLEWRDLSGGWHDAGDYNKYIEDFENTQWSVFSLSLAYQLNSGYWNDVAADLYDTDAPDIVDEMVWGAKFLQKMTVNVSEGAEYAARVLCGIFTTDNGQYSRFGYWGEPAGETDGIINTGDERTVGSLYNVSGMPEYQQHDYGYLFVNSPAAFITGAALANTANVQRSFSYWDAKTESPFNLYSNATLIYESHRDTVFDDLGEIDAETSAKEVFTALLCVTALARWSNETGDSVKYSSYVVDGNKLRNALLDAGSPLKITTSTSAHSYYEHYEILAVSLFEQLVNGSYSSPLRTTIISYSENSILPFCNETGNFFHFVKSWGDYFGYWGSNWPLSSCSMAAMLNWNITGNDSNYAWLKQYALDNVVNWIMGRNPLDICQIESLGARNLPIYHNRYASIPGNLRGAVPGIVPNGIAKPKMSPEFIAGFSNEYVAYDNAPDIPWFDMSQPNPEKIELGDFRSNEVYITQSANFILSFSMAMHVLNVYD